MNGRVRGRLTAPGLVSMVLVRVKFLDQSALMLSSLQLPDDVALERRRAMASSAAAFGKATFSKRPRLEEPGVLLAGDDSALPEAEATKWRDEVARITRSGEQWTDEAFPAVQLSISGKAEKAPEPAPEPARPPPPPPAPGEPPRCACGVAAASATVKRDTANKGRQYWHCPTRRCSFFGWADGGEVAFRRDGAAAKLEWSRMPHALHIVSDYGFRAEDLRQGGVGDCWFVSALAVVAQRHDLIAQIFGADTARNAPGCYCLRLFIDGAWSSVWIDDLLPVTSAPRREALAFDTRLAFCRTGSASGAQQLWGSLVEKAYAKAHGSYQAISGGWIAEALLDLTGAPTEMIDLGDERFDSELMWARLRAYHQLGLPMGCGTNNAEGSQNLKEVGLVGGHAYSILDVRNACTTAGEVVRLLRVRNPHGCTEWNGDWSDQSQMWAQLIDSDAGGASSDAALPRGSFERTGVDDGTFWIDYTKFMMGFTDVDVCYALRGWHARSFANHFPSDRRTSRRVCASVLTVRAAASRPTTLMVMALQPTKRGAWCRADRKRSYRLGDLSVIIARLSDDGTSIASLVGGGLRGADRGERTWVARLDQPSASYVVIPLCLSNSPTAAETTARQPFAIRLWSSEPLRVTRLSSYPPHEAATAPQIEWSSHLALQAIHLALISELTPPLPMPRGLGRAEELERLMLMPEHAALLMDGGAGAHVSRKLVYLGEKAAALVVKGSELILIAGYNWGRADEAPLPLRATAFVKSCNARSVDGLLSNNKEAADAYYRRVSAEAEASKAADAQAGRPARAEREYTPRWPAKWAAFSCTATLPPQSRRLLMVVAASGTQYAIGELLVEIAHDTSAASSVAASAATKRETSAVETASAASAMAKWLGGGVGLSDAGRAGGSPSLGESPWSRGSSIEGIFAPAPLSRDDWLAAQVFLQSKDRRANASGGSSSGGGGSDAADEEAVLRAVLEASAREHAEREEAVLSEALLLNNDSAPVPTHTAHAEHDDSELAAAIAASLAHVPDATEAAAEDEALHRALELSRSEAAQEGHARGGSAQAPIELSDSDAPIELSDSD